MQRSVTVPVIVRRDYAVGYELSGDNMLVHVKVHHWTADAARQFRKDIDAAHEMLGHPVFAVVPPDRPNLPKFLRLHGFVPHGAVLNQRGERAPFFVRYPPDGRLDRNILLDGD